jgi:putative transposase
MLLTFKLNHHQYLEAELTKAKKVAIFAMQTGSQSSKDVKEIGLPSVIACQVLRKYARNRKLKNVHKVVLTVPVKQ